MKIFIFLSFLLFSFISCTKAPNFKEGECVLTPDGLVTLVIKVEKESYVTKERANGVWSKDFSRPHSSLSKSKGDVVTPCP